MAWFLAVMPLAFQWFAHPMPIAKWQLTFPTHGASRQRVFPVATCIYDTSQLYKYIYIYMNMHIHIYASKSTRPHVSSKRPKPKHWVQSDNLTIILMVEMLSLAPKLFLQDLHKTSNESIFPTLSMTSSTFPFWGEWMLESPSKWVLPGTEFSSKQ